MSDEELIARMHDIAHEYPAIVNHLIARHTGLVNYIVSTLGLTGRNHSMFKLKEEKIIEILRQKFILSAHFPQKFG